VVQRRGANASEASHEPWSHVLWRRATVLAAAHRTLAPFKEVEPARLLVLCTNLALRRSFLNRFVWCSAEQRRAANASAASYVRREHGAEVS